VAKILVADDSKVIRAMVTKALVGAGHEVREVEDGKAAMEEIRKETPDLCVLDVEMPHMDGYTVVRQIRAAEAPVKEIPILMLTSKGKYRDMFHMEGVDDFVEKTPDAMEILVAKVGKLLS
jgi:CheY-like chemotaxis protein